MKKVLTICCVVMATLLPLGKAYSQTATDWFITVWKSDNPSDRSGNTNTSIAFPGIGHGYTLKWEDVNNPAQNGTVTVASSSPYTPYILNVPAIGTYRIYAHKGTTGFFYGFSHSREDLTDPKKLIFVEQWGNTLWEVRLLGAAEGLISAFNNCQNMDVTATDRPNLTLARSLAGTFSNCRSLTNSNGSISGWITTNITDMSGVFYGASSFNNPLNWDTQNVTDMGSMFYSATAFNQPLNFDTRNVTDMSDMFGGATSFNSPFGGNWDTQKVEYMDEMFQSATAFNQPIGNWNTQSVKNMRRMFYGATAFNQPIGNWDTQKVTDMEWMFYDATAFNQPLDWNTSAVTDMSDMFCKATSFNSPFGSNWDTRNVQYMGRMFLGAGAFNQPIGNWNTSNVIDMERMFAGAASFNQPINWNTEKVTNMWGMFAGTASFNQTLENLDINVANNMLHILVLSGISCENLSLTLEGWKNQAVTLNKTGIALGTLPGSYNEIGREALNTLKTTYNWTSDNTPTFAPNCIPLRDWFITVWELPPGHTSLIFGGSGNTNTDIYTIYYERINCTTGEVITGAGAHSGLITNASLNHHITGLEDDGCYRIYAHTGTAGAGRSFSGFQADMSSTTNLKRVEQWGNTVWATDGLQYAFSDCSDMDVTATDKPDLTVATSLSQMFYGCSSLVNSNGSIGSWVTSNITHMSGMFQSATLFNSNISSWNTAKVVNMNSMFYGATAFNQDISRWNTASVEDMGSMFTGASAFNRDIGGWNTEKVTAMNDMFNGATAFNRDIGRWNTEKVTNMDNMFAYATSFNQSLAGLELKAVTTMLDIVTNSGLDCENLSLSLEGWKNQAVALSKTGIYLGTLPARYNEIGQAALATLKASPLNWISDNTPALVPNCLKDNEWFITVWKLPAGVTSLTFGGMGNTPTDQYSIMYERIDCTTGAALSAPTTITNATENYVISGLVADACYRIYAHIGAVGAGRSFSGFKAYWSSSTYLKEVEQWGNTVWAANGLSQAFQHCSKMDITATDKPDLTNVTNFVFTFESCASLQNTNGSIGSWNTQNVTDMSYMFRDAVLFNQPLNWNTAKVTSMVEMFYGAEAFNQDISGWNTAKVTSMENMFYGATAFNRDISSWNTAKVTSMKYMFYGATAFNQSLAGLEINDVTNMIDIVYRSGLDCENLSLSLEGWKNQAVALNKTGISLGSLTDIYNATGQAALAALKAPPYNWTSTTTPTLIPNCAPTADWYISVWDMSKTGTTGTDLRTNLIGNNFSVEYVRLDALGNEEPATRTVVRNATGNTAAPYTINGLTAGAKYRIKAHSWAGQLTALTMSWYYSDNERLVEVEQWGNTAWQSAAYAFKGASNLDITASDSPDFSQCTDMKFMFMESKVTTSIKHWDVSKVENMEFMFLNTPFNQNIGSWNLQSLQMAGQMLCNTNMSCAVADSVFTGWASNGNTASTVSFGTQCGLPYGPRGQQALNILANTKGWTGINASGYSVACGAGQKYPTDYVVVCDMSKPASFGGTTTDLRTNLIGNGFSIEYTELDALGAEIPTTLTHVVVSGTAATPAILTGLTAGTKYRIRAYSGAGQLTGMNHNGDKQRILDVEQWGNTHWTHLDNAFGEATHMDVTATDRPDLSGVTSLDFMFSGADSLRNTNRSIGNWDVSGIVNMSFMFFDTDKFNQPLDKWDVSMVKNTNHMFRYATSFDQNLGMWNLQSFENGRDMFWGSGMSCSSYSRTLIGWAANPNTKNGVEFRFQNGMVYNRNAKTAREVTLPAKGWLFDGSDIYQAYCGFYTWTGATDTHFGNITNWQSSKIPPAGGDVAFDPAAVNDMHITTGSSNTVGYFINETDKRLVVEPGASLTLEGAVTGSEALAKADKIHVQSNATGVAGSLILAGQPATDPVYGTVYMPVKSGKLPSPASWTDNITGSPTNGRPQRVNYTWQYFGSPVEQVKADDTFYGTYLREYSEPRNAPSDFYGKWIDLNNNSTLSAFKGYEISQERPHGSNPIYWIKGRLVHGDRTLTLTRKAAAVAGATGNNLHYGLGQNIFGNSYTAAIAIDSIVFPPEAEQTVYLYRTGSLADWGAATTVATTEAAWTAGNYLAIPAKVSSVLNNGQIPSMQGFLLRFTDTETTYGGADATVTIRYGTNRVIPNTKPQMAPAYSGASGSSESDNSGSNGNSDGLSYMQVTLGSRTTTDNLWLFEQEGTSERFDNGWDGRKYFGTPASFIYVKSPDGELQVSTNSTLDGTLITHYANRDTAYTLTLTRRNMPSESNPLYLIDLVERRYTSLTDDTVRYAFTVSAHNVAVKRFMLTSRKPGGEVIGSESDTELLDLYFTPDGEVVLNNFTKEGGTATLYDVSGRVAGRYSAPVGTTRISLRHLPAGVYFATVEASTQRKTEKGVISIGQ